MANCFKGPFFAQKEDKGREADDKLIDIPIEEKVLYFLTIFTKSMGCSETLFKGTREANNDSYIS